MTDDAHRAEAARDSAEKLRAIAETIREQPAKSADYEARNSAKRP